jgi:hypothetical protein
VHDHAGQALSIYVDGQPAGPAPQTLDLPSGQHELYERDETRRSAARTVAVVKGATLDVELEAVPITGKIEVHADDLHVVITVDGRMVATGSFTGDLPVGPHALTVWREHYVTQTQAFVVSEQVPVTWSPQLSPDTPSAPPPDETSDRVQAPRGTIGSFQVLAITQVGSMGSQLDKRCADVGSGCTGASPLGGGLIWSGGYMWGRFGFDIVMATGVDSGGGGATLHDGSQQHYQFYRLNGLGAVRARFAHETEVWRISGAAGLGLAEHVMGLSPGGVADYAALGVSLDGSAALRLSHNVALALGAQLWIDNAGQSTAVKSDASTTPFLVASGTQVLLLPHFGFDFGAF